MGIRGPLGNIWTTNGKVGVIPYEISEITFTDDAERQLVKDAIEHWQEKTLIRFVEKTDQKRYVKFAMSNKGCGSDHGMQGKEGDVKEHLITCNRAGLFKGSIIHEIGHSVGIGHEHQREDRAKFVEVIEANIENYERDRDQYRVFGRGDIGSYDYESIMHYKRTVGSLNGGDTIRPLHLKPGQETGRREKLSQGDRRAVSFLYAKEVQATADVNVAGNQFGYAVATFGKFAIVGTSDESNSDGSVYIFQQGPPILNNEQGKKEYGWWQPHKSILVSAGLKGRNFGEAVAMSDRYALVGAPGDAHMPGAAFLYKKNNDRDEWEFWSRLNPTHSAPGDRFGHSVALSGREAIVGAPGSRSVYTFIPDPDGISPGEPKWIQSQRIEGNQDGFGWSVSMSGSKAIVGISDEDRNGQGVRIYSKEGNVWSEQSVIEAGASQDGFGHSVSFSDNIAIVGAPKEEGLRGAVYVLTQNGGDWESKQLVASERAVNDLFGEAVSIFKGKILVGAPQDGRAPNIGSAYLFQHQGGRLTFVEKHYARDRQIANLYGSAVSVGDDFVAIGARCSKNFDVVSGSAYIYPNV